MRARTVLIVGAGVAGPSLAWWLRRAGFTPTLVEQAPALRTGGYLIDFWGVGYDVAERMGLLPRLHEVGYDIDELRIVDSHGRRRATLQVEVIRKVTKGRYVSLMRSDLSRAIYDLLGGEVETLFGDTVTRLDEDREGVEVTFRHAAPRRFDLVVGAGGLHSVVRQLIFGPDHRFERYLRYCTAAFTAEGYPHRDEGVYLSHSAPGRQAARYALRDGRSAFFFIFAADQPPAVAPHDLPGQRAVLHRLFGGTGWEADEFLAAMDTATDLYFDRVAQAVVPAWSRGRIALLGDAAYSPSLLAGQGSAFAMTGAQVLAHELAAADGDHRVAFPAYERRFRPFVEAKQRSAARFGGWFAPRSRPGLWLRDQVTRLLNVPVIGELLAGGTLSDRFTLPA